MSSALLILFLFWSVAEGQTLSQGMDDTRAFTTGGSASWFGETTTYKNDGDAVQSGAITDFQQTWMQTTMYGPCTFSFWWKVSSENNYDYLQFYIDGVFQVHISGEQDWQQKWFVLANAQAYTLKWVYEKDESEFDGSDCGWVDWLQRGAPATGNTYTGDDHAIALWQMENDGSGGVEPDDSISAVTLTRTDAVALDTTNYREASASGSFNAAGSAMYCGVASLPAEFPLTSSNNQMSFCFWVRCTTLPGLGSNQVAAANSTEVAPFKGTWGVFLYNQAGNTKIQFFTCNDNPLSSREYAYHGSALAQSRWYHVGVTFNNDTHAWTIRVWDDFDAVILGTDASGNFVNTACYKGEELHVGGQDVFGYRIRGNLDEVVFFNDLLTATEIDQIRQGCYRNAIVPEPSKKRGQVIVIRNN